MNKKFLTLLGVATLSSLLVGNASAEEVVPDTTDKSSFYATGNIGGSVYSSKFEFTATKKITEGQNNEGRTIEDYKGAVLTDYKSEIMRGINIDVGAGYQIDDQFRAEIIGRFNPKMKERDKSDVKTVEYNYSSFGGLLNLYFDVKNDSALTPYVMAGGGMERVTAKMSKLPDYLGLTNARIIKINSSNDKDSSSKDGDQITGDIETTKAEYKFAFNVGAGVSYKVSDGIYIDLGYKLMNSPEITKFPNISVIGTYKEKEGSAEQNITESYEEIKIKSGFEHVVSIGARVHF